MPEISKMVTLSTSHLSRELGEDGLHSVDCVVVHRLEPGWLMLVPDVADGERCPTALLYLCRFVRGLGCEWVKFDPDGPVEPGLRTWCW